MYHIDGWMNDLQFYLFNSISCISGQWEDDNKKLCAMEPNLRFETLPPRVQIEPGTTNSAGQHLTL